MNVFTKKLIEIDEIPGAVAQLYKNVFSTDEGRLVLQDLKNRSYVDATTLTEPQSGVIYYNEGMRSVMLHIDSQMNWEAEPKENVVQ